jgi:hypothetical protein
MVGLETRGGGPAKEDLRRKTRGGGPAKEDPRRKTRVGDPRRRTRGGDPRRSAGAPLQVSFARRPDSLTAPAGGNGLIARAHLGRTGRALGQNQALPSNLIKGLRKFYVEDQHSSKGHRLGTRFYFSLNININMTRQLNYLASRPLRGPPLPRM